MRRNIALGAAGIALTAGSAAAGVALANKGTRRKITTGAKKAVRGFRRIRETLGERGAYQAVAHRIGITRGRKGKGRKKLRRG